VRHEAVPEAGAPVLAMKPCPLHAAVRMSDVTRILDALQHGDAEAAEELLPLAVKS